MSEIIIDKEFETLLVPLTENEFSGLEQSVLEEGCRVPLDIWNNILIDGHNRYAICQNHGISFKTNEMKFESREDVKIWIIKNQLSRRNMTLFQKAELALLSKPLFTKKAKENQGTRTDICQNSDRSSIDTKNEIAKMAGVSHDTIHRTEKILNSTSDELKHQVRNGDISINQAYIKINSQEQKQKNDKLKSKPTTLPVEKYSTIIIDPPWGSKKIERYVRLLMANYTDPVPAINFDPPSSI